MTQQLVRWCAAIVVAGATVAGLGAAGPANAAAHLWARTGTISADVATAEPVPDAATGLVFIAATSKVLVADGRSDRIVSTISVPGVQLKRMAIDSAHGQLFAIGGSASVIIIDADVRSVIRRVALPFTPSGVAVDQATGMVYMTAARGVYELDPHSNQTRKVAELTSAADELVVNAASHRIWVSQMFSITVIDPETGAARDVLPGTASSHITIDASAGIGYVTAADRHGVVAVQEDTGRELATIPTGHLPLRSALDTSTHTLLVTDDHDNTVTAVDTNTNTITDVVPVPSRPWWIATNSNTAKAYVSSLTADPITVLGRVAPPRITTTALPSARTGTAYATQLHADAQIDTWAVTDGQLPAGLHISSTTGLISGTPHHPGTATITITAGNAAGHDTRSYTLEVVSSPYGDATTGNDAKPGNNAKPAASDARSDPIHLPVVSG